jgi:hypothetical protein
MRRAPEGQRDEIVSLWGDVIEFDTDGEIRTFLRHFWISHHGDIKTQRLYREIKDTIIARDIDSLTFSRNLKDTSIVYKDVIEGRDNDPIVENLLKNIAELGASILYPIVLSVMEVVPTESRIGILQAVTFVRHSVIGQLENSKLENVIYRIATELRAGKSVEDAIKELSEFAPNDDDFRHSFERVSINRTATQRYVLGELELDLRTTAELAVAPPHRVHVEHIYPQSPEPEHRAANHGQILNRIGNLTLLDRSLNSAIKNGTFDKKVPSYAKSEILLTNTLTNYAGWDSEKIVERQEKLADRAPTIWAFPK